MGVLDSVIRTLSPQWALERTVASKKLELFDKVRKYSGASYGPLAEDWYAPGTSAKAETNHDIITLRDRMREMGRNDGWAQHAIISIANNVIGNGIRPSVKASPSVKAKVEKDFIAWAESTTVDYYGRCNLFGLQHLMMKGVVTSGDVLMVKRYTGRGKNRQLSVQILESDYIVHWYTNFKPNGRAEGSYVLNGIYFDETDKVIGYELYRQHPGDTMKYHNAYEHEFVSIEDCVLIYRADRPGQHRGVPEGHSVMLEHKMLAQYELAQSHRQTIAASFAAFITTSNPGEMGQENGSNEPRYENMTGQRIRPGSINYLYPGEEIELAQPPKVDDFDPYIKSKLRKMAAGWGLSYSVFSGDMSSASFSSERMGWIEMHRNVQSWQQFVAILKFCDPIWKWWMELEMLKGNIDFEAEISCDWTAPRREMVDPVKETKAMIDQIQAGIKTYPEAIREMGKDPMVHMADIQESNNDLDKHGLVLSSDYRVIDKQKTKETPISAP